MKNLRPIMEIIIGGLILGFAVSIFFLTRPKETTLTLNDGQMTYVGTVKNDRLNGQGELTYENGDTYSGGFKNGAFMGQGTFVSHEGWQYAGEFVNGLADGQGELTTEDGTVYSGTFKQGVHQK